MISWLKSFFAKPADRVSDSGPATPAIFGNPAKGYQLKLTVTGPAGERVETIDLVETLSSVFTGLGREHVKEKGCLIDEESGLSFRPGVAGFQPNDDLSMQTTTTIEIRHPVHLRHAFFEYQHSAGETGEDSFKKGFESWARVDLPVVLDAVAPKLGTCTALEMKFPNGKSRRVVLGPVSYMGPARSEAEPAVDDADAHPPFCSCCLFTHSMKAFQQLLTADLPFAIRLFAMRNDDGTAEADCRVNGEDFAEGGAALKAYVGTWPSQGFEARKQYILIQDDPNPAQPAA